MGTAWSWVNHVFDDPDEPLTIMCMGLAGAGKSTLARQLSLQLGGIETVREHYRRRRKEEKEAAAAARGKDPQPLRPAPRRRVPPALRLRALSDASTVQTGPMPIRQLHFSGPHASMSGSDGSAPGGEKLSADSPLMVQPLSGGAQTQQQQHSQADYPATPKLLRRRGITDVKSPSAGVMEMDVSIPAPHQLCLPTDGSGSETSSAVSGGIHHHASGAFAGFSTAAAAACVAPASPTSVCGASFSGPNGPTYVDPTRNSPVNAISALPALVTTSPVGPASSFAAAAVVRSDSDSSACGRFIPPGLPVPLDPTTIRLPVLVPRPPISSDPESDEETDEEETSSAEDEYAYTADLGGSDHAVVHAAGFNVDQFDFDRTAVEFWDLAGSELHRQVWSEYFDVGVNGVVYVIDGTADESEIAYALDLLFENLAADEITKPVTAPAEANKDSPLLILVNKCDIETRGYLSAADIAQRFRLNDRIEALVRAKRGLETAPELLDEQSPPPPTSRVATGPAAIGSTRVEGHAAPLSARWAIFDCSASTGHNVDAAMRWLVDAMKS